MSYIVRMLCINEDNKYNLKYHSIVYLDNVLGREKFTKDKENACKFISGVRAQNMCDKINANKNFVCDVIKYN